MNDSEIRVTLYSRNGEGIPLAPVTKKNHGEVLCPHEIRSIHRHFVQPSPQYKLWEAGCSRAAVYDRTAPAITFDVNCTALIYRDRNVGDASGFYNAIGDCLQALGIVANDKHIVSWDGTRLLKDPENPRVEVVLTPISGAQPDLGLGLSADDTRHAAIARKQELKAKRKELARV